MNYRPRRSSATFSEGAPEYVLACYDSGPKISDRYTVLFGGSLLCEDLLKLRKVFFLGFNEVPTSPNMGVSQWGEIDAYDRKALGKHIRWLDLPEHLRRHVIARATAV